MFPQQWCKMRVGGISTITPAEGDVNMEVTSTPGLTDEKGEDETTLEKYQQKLKGKREKRPGRLPRRRERNRRRNLNNRWMTPSMRIAGVRRMRRWRRRERKK